MPPFADGVAARVSRAVAIGAWLLLSCMPACKPKAEPPMRIAVNVWPGYEPLFLARRAGLLPEKDFRLVEFSSNSAGGRAFRNGEVEALCSTLDEVFYFAQSGMDPVILLVPDESNGAEVVLGRPGIRSMADLKGKRVAVELGAVETYTLTRALQNAGLSLADVTLVYAPMEEHLQDFESGAVDAVVTFEPMRSRLLALGAVKLFDSSQIPGEIVDVLAVRRDYMEAHPERMMELRHAWFAGLREMLRKPAEAVKFLAAREQVSAAEFETSLQGLRFPDEAENRMLLEGRRPRLLTSAERLKAVMLAAGLLHKNIDVKSLLRPAEQLDAGRK
jgi:NitT/TauT family transport system substrate-binding protein